MMAPAIEGAHFSHVIGFVEEALRFELVKAVGRKGRRKYFVVQVFNVLPYKINKSSLVLLYRTTNLHECLQRKDHDRQRKHVPLA